MPTTHHRKVYGPLNSTSDAPPLSKNKRGRPTLYTPELAERICELLETGRSLQSICNSDGIPSRRAVAGWVTSPDIAPGFAERYARARGLGLDALVEECLEIAADRSRDPNCRRVEIDARKWFASKMRPDKYGDRTTLEHQGAGGVPLSVEIRFVDPGKPVAPAAKQIEPGK